jgi:predicted small lipoprotein YifL
VDRRRFALTLLAAGLMSGVAACGRRGPLEPPADTEQGRAWQKRVGDNKQQQQRTPGAVRNSLERDDDQKGTVDVEADIERPRSEGLAREPVDPVQAPIGQPAPGQPVVGQTGGNAAIPGGRRRPPGIVPPKRDFVLDGLLE